MKKAAGQETSRLALSGEIHLPQEMTDAGSLSGLAERRLKPRLKEAFPTKVWGTDAECELFELDCELDNVSSTGVYLRLPRQMKLGAGMHVVVKLVNGRRGATAFLMTEVLRDEPQRNRHHGLALAIKDHHFL